MAIQWADNFNNYGTDTVKMLDGIYAQVTNINLVNDPDPLATGRTIQVLSTFDTSAPFDNISTLRKTYSSGISTAGISFRLWVSALPDNDNGLIGCRFTNAANTPQVSVRLLSNGALQVTRGDYRPGVFSGTGGTILGTSTSVITPNAWHHIEVKTLIDVSGGTVEIRVNGITVLSLTGQNTSQSGLTVDQINVTNGKSTTSSTVNMFVKDLILWDTTGSRNNDFLGSVSVFTLLPDSDVSLNWTPSTGTTGFNLIDEQNPVNDADFISAGNPPPSPAVFTVSNLPPDIVSVRALIPVVRARKIDGGDGNIQTGLTGTLTNLGANRPITSAFTYWWDVSELSPDTAAAWTPVEVDAVKLRLNRTL